MLVAVVMGCTTERQQDVQFGPVGFVHRQQLFRIVEFIWLPQMPATTKEQPGWYTPKRLLALFCVQLLLTWLDLGIFASNYGALQTSAGSVEQDQLQLNLFPRSHGVRA